MGRLRDYKGILITQLRLVGIPEPQYEFVFALPRKWRFDFCWEDVRIAVEYQGGNYFGKGAHNTVSGLTRDYEKFTEAALRGWMLILIDAGTVRSGQALEWIERAFAARKNGKMFVRSDRL